METPILNALHTRLRQWSPLTSHELPFIKDAVGDLSEELERLESRIHSSKEELRQLERQRDGVRMSLEAHHALMAPIRTLPLELLSEIFSLICAEIVISYEEKEIYVPGEDSECRVVGHTALSIPPLVLSQVCSTWTSLVNYDTSMWSRVSISFMMVIYLVEDNSLVPGTERMEDALACIFSRSGNALLDIYLRCYNDRSEMALGLELRPILARVLDQKHRWKSADIFFPYEAPTQLCDPMPALETLSFSMNSYAAVPSDAQAGHFFGQAPALRTVTFRSSEAFSRAMISWVGLHTLVFEIPDYEPALSTSQLKSVLMQCKSLRTLTWEACVGPVEDNEPVILPVTSLVADSTADHLLPHIALPNLKTLTITISSRSGLSSVQEKYRNLITTLELSGPEHFTEPMLARLGSFPQVKTLIVSYVGRDGLTCDLQEIPHRFPKLRFLSYKITASASYFNGIFSRVVRLIKAFERSEDVSDGSPSREIHSVLQKVELQGFVYESLSEEQQQQLRDVTKSGLALEVPGRVYQTMGLDE